MRRVHAVMAVDFKFGAHNVSTLFRPALSIPDGLFVDFNQLPITWAFQLISLQALLCRFKMCAAVAFCPPVPVPQRALLWKQIIGNLFFRARSRYRSCQNKRESRSHPSWPTHLAVALFLKPLRQVLVQQHVENLPHLGFFGFPVKG